MLFTKYELSKKHEIKEFEGPIYLHEGFLENKSRQIQQL